jgi:hypothetical protein
MKGGLDSPAADLPSLLLDARMVDYILPRRGKIARVVLRVLKGLEEVLTADDKPINPQYLKAKAWPSGTSSLSTEDLRRAFAQRMALKMLLNIEQLKRTICAGIGKGIWIYDSGDEKAGDGTVSPAPLVEVSDDVLLYTPEEALRPGIKIKGAAVEPQVCPVCRKADYTCGHEQEEPVAKKPVRVQAEGPPAQSFQAVADQRHDQQVESAPALVGSC